MPHTDDVTIFGPDYSTYTRTVRLLLEEKRVKYRLKKVDFLRGANRSIEHLARHPFGKVPVLQHGSFMVRETSAITCYIDESFYAPALQPRDLQTRARMLEVVGIIVSYIYPVIVGDIVVQRLVNPLIGQDPDEVVIEKAVHRLQKSLNVLERYIQEHTYLIGDSVTLADLYLIPMWAYFLQTPEGNGVVEVPRNLSHWWRSVKDRPSVLSTDAALG